MKRPQVNLIFGGLYHTSHFNSYKTNKSSFTRSKMICLSYKSWTRTSSKLDICPPNIKLDIYVYVLLMVSLTLNHYHR